jgi:hypothetical protein
MRNDLIPNFGYQLRAILDFGDQAGARQPAALKKFIPQFRLDSASGGHF